MFCPFSRETNWHKLRKLYLDMSSSDSQIDKPQRGRSKRAELAPDVNREIFIVNWRSVFGERFQNTEFSVLFPNTVCKINNRIAQQLIVIHSVSLSFNVLPTLAALSLNLSHFPFIAECCLRTVNSISFTGLGLTDTTRKIRIFCWNCAFY